MADEQQQLEREKQLLSEVRTYEAQTEDLSIELDGLLEELQLFKQTLVQQIEKLTANIRPEVATASDGTPLLYRDASHHVAVLAHGLETMSQLAHDMYNDVGAIRARLSKNYDNYIRVRNAWMDSLSQLHAQSDQVDQQAVVSVLVGDAAAEQGL